MAPAHLWTNVNTSVDKCATLLLTSPVPFEIEHSDRFAAWWTTLSDDKQEQLLAVVEVLAEEGPALGRPLVDTMRQSRHSNMKELRWGTLRVLFAFDPRRTAILLVEGDNRGEWNRWYKRMIPAADQILDDHLRSLRQH